MTYRKWIELSKNYSALILSINFDVHSWKYKKFVKKILGYFPRNKKIIVAAGNETFEKRGSAEKVYQTAKEVHEAMQDIGKFYPIAFWNEKIHTTGERTALEKLLNDSRVKNICEYFGFQSLGTSNSNVDKYVKLAKQKGFKPGDFEIGTTKKYFDGIDGIKKKFDLNRNLGIDDVVILAPVINKKLFDDYSIWGKYALIIDDAPEGGIVKDKAKLIKYIQQFREEEMGIKIADEYRLNDKDDKVIDWIQAMLFYANYLLKPIKFGHFDIKTEEAVKRWQLENKVEITGIITKYHISVLINKFVNPETKELDPEQAFRQLMIYAS